MSTKIRLVSSQEVRRFHKAKVFELKLPQRAKTVTRKKRTRPVLNWYQASNSGFMCLLCACDHMTEEPQSGMKLKPVPAHLEDQVQHCLSCHRTVSYLDFIEPELEDVCVWLHAKN